MSSWLGLYATCAEQRTRVHALMAMHSSVASCVADMPGGTSVPLSLRVLLYMCVCVRAHMHTCVYVTYLCT